MRGPKPYEEESHKLAKAIDVAREAFEKKPSKFSNSDVAWFITCYSEWKQKALSPEPQFKKLSSLKYLASDTFTYFQEGAGETVEYFWQRMKEENLDFKREDRLTKILKTGKIKGRIEYDYVIDLLVPAQQSGYINEEQATTLSNMIAVYEKRRTTSDF